MDDPSSTPTLKVMRLQAPHLGQPSAGQLLSSTHLLSSSLTLPDSFGVIHVGETFSAYLGVLNPSFDLPVRGLSVAVQLQTPSKRIVLPSRLDGDDKEDVPPGGGVDTIVSKRLEEAGQHILRVEVGYIANGAKTLRKFYRFNVAIPLNITESVVRSGDSKCLVSISVENVMEKHASAVGSVTVSGVGFEAATGLVAERVDADDNQSDLEKVTAETNKLSFEKQQKSALDLFDSCGRLEPGESIQYLFYVTAESEAAALRGIAFGDELGQACVTYRKTMGEKGTIYSSTVVCPPTSFVENKSNSKFVVYGSGLSVDVAAASASRSSSGRRNSNDSRGSLEELLPVTVEPIDPPSNMKLSQPQSIALLIVNHSTRPMNLQLQFRLPSMNGVVVCGPSFITLGEIPPSGGSCTIDVNFVALVAGLFLVQGCYIVDMTTGMEIQQPALFNVFVELQQDGYEEKKSMH
jgi:hypothetical protein